MHEPTNSPRRTTAPDLRTAADLATRRARRLPLLALLACLGLGIGEATAREAPPSRSGEARAASGQLVRTADGEELSMTLEESLEADLRIGSEPPGARAFGPERRAVEPASFAGASSASSLIGLEKVWEMSIWGTSIGRNGLIAADLDGDGSLELVAGASLAGGFSANTAWHVARHDPDSGDYELVFTKNEGSVGVSHVQVLELAGETKILVGLGNGDIRMYDAASLELEDELGVANGAVTAILVADADNDDEAELVVASATATYLLSPDDLGQELSLPFGAAEIAVGNVDADAALEIVYVTGAVVQLDGLTWVTQWDFSTFAAGAYLELSDVDGDGMAEIISGRRWYYIDVYDADLRSPKGQIRTDLDIHDVLMADVTGDGVDELLYGDAQWGNIYAHDAGTLKELWRIRNPEHGTTRIAVGDVDDDGGLEVVWGGGWTSTGEDHLYVHDVATLALEFESVDLVGPFHAVDMADVDGDGTEEIVAVSFESDSGYSDGVVHVYDGESFDLEWRSGTELFDGRAWTGVHDVAIGDVDGDGETEIVVGTDRLYDGAIYVIDGKTRAVESQFLFDDGSPIYALAIRDFDGDGVAEIIAGGGKEHTGSPGTYAYVIDGVTGAVDWHSTSLSASFADVFAIESAPLGADAVPEIVVSLDSLFVIDGATRAIRKSTETDYRGFALGDTDGDGVPEIWAGATDGRLYRVDAATLVRTEMAKVCDDDVYSVKLDRADNLTGSVQFSCAGNVGVYGIFEDAVLWRSETIENPSTSGDAQVGYANNLAVADRGRQALLVAGTRHGVAAWQGYGTGDTDLDADGVPNHLDNCVDTPNPGQEDTDGDGVGDACNGALDADGDEWADALDNCVRVANPRQEDADSDGVGDACNDAIDVDGDEWSNTLDNCPAVRNPLQADRDDDAIGDACDPYPDDADHFVAECRIAIDSNEVLGRALEACEAQPRFVDRDADGEADVTDACPQTLPGEPVDAAGCSVAQFCGALSGRGPWGRRTCKRSDWNNDEPLTPNPQDCRAERVGGLLSEEFICVVR